MSYFDIIPSDAIFIIFRKLDYTSFISLYRAYKSNKNSQILITYNNDKMWYHILCTFFPHLHDILSRAKYTSHNYKYLYYCYKDNYKGARSLLDSPDISISSSRQQNIGILKFMPDIISRLWLSSAYPYIYENLIAISGNRPIKYNQYKPHSIVIDRSWMNILNSISYSEYKCDRCPSFYSVTSYLRDGMEIPNDFDIRYVFDKSSRDGRVFIIAWLLSIDPDIVVPNDYVMPSLRIGIKLRHIEGIRLFLNKLDINRVAHISWVYRTPLKPDAIKIDTLMKFITNNIDILSKE